MRKVFMLMALCLVGALVFVPAALAQDPCPDPDFPRATPDGCQASDLPDVIPASASPSASASASTSASASAASTGDLDCGQLSEAEEQAVFDADPTDPNGLDADDDGLPCEDDTTDDGSYPAQEQPMVEEPTMTEEPTETQYNGSNTGGTTPTTSTTVALPETGGASVIALSAGVLLVTGGLLARRIVR